MKLTFNLTTCEEDLNRYRDRDDLVSALKSFDGLELMHCGEDVRNVVPRDLILGVHLCFFPCWYDSFVGGMSGSECSGCPDKKHGYSTRESLVSAYRKDIDKAKDEGAKYVVFHVSDCSDEELFTLRYHHTSREIVNATIELINVLFPDTDGNLALLLENLWHPGLTMTEPEVTQQLLSGIIYKNKGIMLDTGHLMHTNLSLKTQEEALAYIQCCIKEHGNGILQSIRGIHLHQSLTGQYMAETAAHPPILSQDPAERMEQVYTHAFRSDQHLPFTCSGIREFIDWIDPEYLTFEFISRSRAEHQTMLREQMSALGLN